MDKSSGHSTLVRNLRFSTTPQVVREAFERFGKIRDVYLPLDFNTKRPRGFGFVEYYEKSDAVDAVKAMDNTDLDGSIINCCLAQDRRKSPSSMRRVYRNRARRNYRSRSNSYRGRRSRTPPRFRDDRRRGYSRERSPRRLYRDRRDGRGYRERYEPNYERDGRRFREPYDRDGRDRNRDRNFREYRGPRDNGRGSRDRFRDERDKFREERVDRGQHDEFREDNSTFRDDFVEERYDYGNEADMERPDHKIDVDSSRDYSASRSRSNN
ncbi:Ser/Arg-rich splicing factor [Theileria orientalis strain Shintoku]|uniref:Ser/Arg-rich splicing factor n=1 Tax=Theileria orientalis strain Shintoku TaxID=869250 RepID=J4DQB1_THEOR|nr:Ser/Arg-rich splicing factor [Theileria orientalis strain Shintoku]PVC49469.1 Ser/Arg-rich splicing factor [Theileria orientalis]BAM42144.1 Ser/Arg-rich splicing factor [Theileria orientalis strain Shintoku]|eukprot:XP_009692445.1 Ser/Arg-rich splicing factor [Theileria orientalis strain Shintoku]